MTGRVYSDSGRVLPAERLADVASDIETLRARLRDLVAD